MGFRGGRARGSVRRVALLAVLLSSCRGDAPADRDAPAPAPSVSAQPAGAGTDVLAPSPPAAESLAATPAAGPAPDAGEAAWTVNTTWRVGSLAGDSLQEFGNVIQLSIGPDGRVYVLDLATRFVSIFDRDGRYVSRFGGGGQGPGEFDSPIAMAWDDRGRLWVSDAFNFWFSVFDADGALLETVPRGVRTFARVGGHRMAFDSVGRIVHEAGWRTAEGAATGFIRLDGAGAALDTLPALPNPFASTSGSEDAAVANQIRAGATLNELRPFASRLVATLAPGGDVVWFSRSDEYRLYERTLEGDTLRVLEGPPVQNRFAEAEERRIEDLLDRANAAGASITARRYGRQLVQAIHVMGGGRLLVQIEESPGEDSSLFHLFDAAGRYAGDVRFPLPVQSAVIPGIAGDTIVVVGRDALGVQYVLRHEIVPPG